MAVTADTDAARAAGTRAARRVETAGNSVSVPMAWNLGLVDFVRRTAQRAGTDQVFSHAGNVAFRALFALFPAMIALVVDASGDSLEDLVVLEVRIVPGKEVGSRRCGRAA